MIIDELRDLLKIAVDFPGIEDICDIKEAENFLDFVDMPEISRRIKKGNIENQLNIIDGWINLFESIPQARLADNYIASNCLQGDEDETVLYFQFPYYLISKKQEGNDNEPLFSLNLCLNNTADISHTQGSEKWFEMLDKHIPKEGPLTWAGAYEVITSYFNENNPLKFLDDIPDEIEIKQ